MGSTGGLGPAWHGVGCLVGIFRELSFGDAEAAEGPLAADEVVEQDAGLGGVGAVAQNDVLSAVVCSVAIWPK